MIRRDVLSVSVRSCRGSAVAEDRKRGISVSFRAIARLFDVAKHLIISTVFFDDVDDVLDRRTTGEQTRLTLTEQTVVAHDLLCVASKRRIVRNINGADVADDERGWVLARGNEATDFAAFFFLVP